MPANGLTIITKGPADYKVFHDSGQRHFGIPAEERNNVRMKVLSRGGELCRLDRRRRTPCFHRGIYLALLERQENSLCSLLAL